MDPLQIIELINDVDSSPCDKVCSLIESVLSRLDSNDFASFMLTNTNSPRDLERIAYAIDVAAWISSDNGSESQRTMESWLSGEDEDRIWVALHSECYPFIDEREMRSSLETLSKRMPKFSDRCAELIKSRSIRS